MLKTIALAACLLAACSKSSSSSGSGSAAPAAEPAGSGGGAMNEADRAAMRHKRLEEMRKRLDTNGDGKLSPDELKEAPGRMHFDDPAALDTNHDGDISIDELEAAMKARREQMRGKWGSGAMGGASAD